MSKTWRIKTEDEFKKENLWNFEFQTPIGWSSHGKMNYLLGTKIPESSYEACEKHTIVWIDNWRINSDSYTSSEVNHAIVPTTANPVIVDDEGAPRFDINRLAKEIDSLFQKVLKKSTEECTVSVNETKSTCNELVSSAKIETQQLIKKYREEIATIFPNIKEELIKEIQKGRTILSFADNTVIPIQDTDHPKMKDVIVSLKMQKKVLLVGPAGTGKTYMVAEIAERLKLPFYKYSCSRDSSVHDLIGYKQPTSETYLETVFLNAYENGGIFLVDKLFVQIY